MFDIEANLREFSLSLMRPPKGCRDEDLLRLVDLCPFLASEKLRYDDAAILKLLQRNPHAARVRHTYRCGIGTIHPLGLVVALGGSLEVVKLMVQACPEALEEKLSGRRTVLHYAIAEGVHVDIIQYLTSQCPSLVSEVDSFQAIPLHLASTYPSSSISVLRYLISIHPDGAKCLDHRSLTPLHRACKARSDLDKVLALVEAFPEAVTLPDWAGTTPQDWSENVGRTLSDSIPEVVEVLGMIKDILSMGDANNHGNCDRAGNILHHFRTIKWWGGIRMAFAMNIGLFSLLNFPMGQLPQLLALLCSDNDVNSDSTDKSSTKFRMESVYLVMVQCPDAVGNVT